MTTSVIKKTSSTVQNNTDATLDIEYATRKAPDEETIDVWGPMVSSARTPQQPAWFGLPPEPSDFEYP